MINKINPILYKLNNNNNYKYYNIYNYIYINNKYFKYLLLYFKYLLFIKKYINIFFYKFYFFFFIIIIELFIIKILFISKILKNINRIKIFFKFKNIFFNFLIFKIIKPFEYSKIYFKFIIKNKKNNISFLKIIKKIFNIIKRTKNINIKGIKIKISGKINNKIKYIEYIKKGKITIKNINFIIDFCFYSIKTKYGLIGIKIYLYK